MKKINKYSIVTTVLAVAFTFGLAGLVKAATATVDLGTAAPFAILANTEITDSPTSTITGNVGLYAGAGSAIGLLCSQVTGTIYARDGTGNSCFTVNDPLLLAAKNDLTAAYIDAAGRTPVTTVATELGGTTKTAGVYASNSSTFQITGGVDGPGPLVLDGQGDPNAVFIFEMNADGTGLTVGPDSVVQLTGQAQACNVFWRVDTATIDTTAVFKGTILALNSITVNDGANIEGRLLARNGNVTLINDTITRSTCAVASSSSTSSSSSTTVTPTLPNTGISPEHKSNAPWNIIISTGAVVTLAYLARRKRVI